MYCSHTVAAYLHTLQALTALPSRMSCRLMMALMSDALEMCARALGTYVPSYIGRSARLFFMRPTRSRGTRGATEAQLSREARSRAIVHVAAPELTSARRRGLEP
jgi:hypothetical protein